MGSGDTKIPLDNSLLLIFNHQDQPLRILSQLDACTGCPLVLQKTINSSNDTSLLLNASYRQIIQVQDVNSNELCNFDYQFYQDQAVYRLELFSQNDSLVALNSSKCALERITQGRNNVWPLAILSSLVLSVICFNLLKDAFSSYLSKRRPSDLIDSNRLDLTIKHASDLDSSRSKRMVSVDVFRGITILSMIFVNYGAGGYVFLDHVPWFGMNASDVIFPAFLFLMGTSIGLSFKSLTTKHENLDVKKIYLKIFKRSCILFLFGLIINSIGQNDLSKLRIPGILQRFSICYLIIACLHLHSLLNINNEPRFLKLNLFYRFYLADIYPFFFEWLVMFVMMSVYLFFTLLFNYDDNCERGYQGPGGLHLNGSQFNCTGGAARQIDVWLLGESHIWQYSTCEAVFRNTLNHDPEGVLGTIGSLLVVFFGLQVAKIQISFTATRMKITRFMIYALVLGTIALVLHFTDSIPICKNLFSLSFAFICSSICFLIFIGLFVVIELQNYWSGYPLAYLGQNALFLYLGHQIGGSMFPFYYEVDNSSHYLLLLRCTLSTLLWLLIAIYMGRKKVFLKL